MQTVSLGRKHLFHKQCIDECVKRNEVWRKDVVGGPNDFIEDEEANVPNEDHALDEVRATYQETRLLQMSRCFLI